MKVLMGRGGEKTKPIQSQFKANQIQFQDPTIFYKGPTKREKVVKKTKKRVLLKTGSVDINLIDYTDISDY